MTIHRRSIIFNVSVDARKIADVIDVRPRITVRNRQRRGTLPIIRHLLGIGSLLYFGRIDTDLDGSLGLNGMCRRQLWCVCQSRSSVFGVIYDIVVGIFLFATKGSASSKHE